MTKVLTFEREYGSGAAAIAQKVAARLGWKLWDQLLTDEICRRMECDRQHVERHEERRDPLHYRLFKAFLRGSFEGSLNEPRMKVADAESIRHLTEALVRGVAAALTSSSVRWRMLSASATLIRGSFKLPSKLPRRKALKKR